MLFNQFGFLNQIHIVGLDLYACFKNNNGHWTFPINMGNKINSEAGERFPIVSPDGKYLFFMRQTETQDFYWVSTELIKQLKNQILDK